MMVYLSLTYQTIWVLFRLKYTYKEILVIFLKHLNPGPYGYYLLLWYCKSCSVIYYFFFRIICIFLCGIQTLWNLFIFRQLIKEKVKIIMIGIRFLIRKFILSYIIKWFRTILSENWKSDRFFIISEFVIKL